MKRHLSDSDIAFLASGTISDDVRQKFLAHLIECKSCNKKALEQLGDDCSNEPDDSTHQDEAPSDAFVCQVLDTVQKEVEMNRTRLEKQKINGVRLFPVDDLLAALPLAADSGTTSTVFPTLASKDGRIVVHFRRTSEDGNIRAYVIQDENLEGMQLSLSFTEERKAFPLEENGEACLTGVNEDELLHGRVEVHLTPLDPDKYIED